MSKLGTQPSAGREKATRSCTFSLACLIIVLIPTQAISQEAKPFRVTIVGAELQRVRPSGQAWDDQNSLPDPFVLLEAPDKQRLGTPWLPDETYPNWGTARIMHLHEGDEIRMAVLDFDGPPDQAVELIGRHRFVFDGKPGLKLFHFGQVKGIGLRFESVERGGEGWGGAAPASKDNPPKLAAPASLPKDLARICVDSAIIQLGKIDGKRWDGIGKVSSSDMEAFNGVLAGAAAALSGLDPTGISLALKGLGIANSATTAPDLYTRVYINSTLQLTTHTIKNSFIGTWNTNNCVQFTIRPTDSIRFSIMDKDELDDDPIGAFSLQGIPKALTKERILVLRQGDQAMAGQVLALQISLQPPQLRYAFGFIFAEAGNRNHVEVINVLQDSSAHLSGLQRGDKILAIDSLTTRGMTKEQLGEAATSKSAMTLTVLRADKGLFDIKMQAGLVSAE